MGFVRRFMQRRQKLKHIRKRAKALLPLCEEATGIKLNERLKIEATNKWKLRIRYIIDLLKGPESDFSGSVSDFRFGIAIRKLTCGSVESAHGYYDPSRVLIGINLDGYKVGNAESEYVLAHEIVHLLVGQVGSHEQVNKNKVLGEGAATFYGSKAIQKIHPSFDVTKDRSFLRGNYAAGYRFFEAVASVVDDPLVTISAIPPGKYIVESPYGGIGYLAEETHRPSKYLERLRKQTTPSVKHQEWIHDAFYFSGEEKKVTKECFSLL